MSSQQQLRQQLYRIDGRGYGAYRDIAGKWQLEGGVILHVDHVQADPFASPSRLRLIVPWHKPEHLTDGDRVRGAAGYLARLAQRIVCDVRGKRGSGRSGQIHLDAGGQQLLDRTAVVIRSDELELRISLGLPAAGRRVLGRTAFELLRDLADGLREGLTLTRAQWDQLRQWADLAEDHAALRQGLEEEELVAFVPDGAQLPRESGVSDLPLPFTEVVPFTSPPSLRVTLSVPHRGAVTGMGIPHGVTLIVGGGYHGKSTLLRGLERGVYDHIPGDGREFLVTVSSAVKVRAEDGRSVAGVDISPFISDLPGGQVTAEFYTQEASGSTSQAANIMEALELGCELLLMDEDTSATNFLIRDARMQRLVRGESEPITPFIDRVRELKDRGVSTIMVMGGSGDYFSVADRVIRMDAYEAHDVTLEAHQISQSMPTGRVEETGGRFQEFSSRRPLPHTINSHRRKRTRAEGRGRDTILFGEETIDLAQVEQLVDPSQTRGVATMMLYARQHYIDGKRSFREVLERVYQDWKDGGWERISPYRGHPGDLAYPRPHEVVASFNRLRSLRTRDLD